MAILGRSGSGKSTLLSLLAGLDQPDAGQILCAGTDITKLAEKPLALFRGKTMGIVFQQYHLISHLTALENVSLPLEILKEHDCQARAIQAIEKVGLEDRLGHFPHQLSGGEKQRVALARAMVTNPRIILADEPSGNLDTSTGEKVMDLLFNLVEDIGTTLVLVTHNEELAARCHEQTRLGNGQLHPLNS
jgi:putative ABC transport system ATP-binding protein